MKFKRVENDYLISLKTGEEVITTLADFCSKNNIRSGIISGIGGAKEVSIAYYDLEKKEYLSKNFEGKNFEILSLNGNVTSVENSAIIHLHGIFGDSDFSTFGGHLQKAVIGITAEIAITTTRGVTSRKLNEEFKLNFWDL